MHLFWKPFILCFAETNSVSVTFTSTGHVWISSGSSGDERQAFTLSRVTLINKSTKGLNIQFNYERITTHQQANNHQIMKFTCFLWHCKCWLCFFFQMTFLKTYLSPPYVLPLPLEAPKITQLRISRSLWGPAEGFGAQRPRNLSNIQCLGAWTNSVLLAWCVWESSRRFLLRLCFVCFMWPPYVNATSGCYQDAYMRFKCLMIPRAWVELVIHHKTWCFLCIQKDQLATMPDLNDHNCQSKVPWLKPWTARPCNSPGFGSKKASFEPKERPEDR